MRNVLDWLDAAAKEAPQSAAFDQPDMGITSKEGAGDRFVYRRAPSGTVTCSYSDRKKSSVHCGYAGHCICKLLLYACGLIYS